MAIIGCAILTREKLEWESLSAFYDEITGEAEERAKKIIDEAELRARGIQNPREPDWESFKVHPSSVPRKGSRHHR